MPETERVPLSEIADGGFFRYRGHAWQRWAYAYESQAECWNCDHRRRDALPPDTLVTPLKLVPASAEVCPKGTMDALRDLVSFIELTANDPDAENRDLANCDIRVLVADAKSILQQAEKLQ